MNLRLVWSLHDRGVEGFEPPSPFNLHLVWILHDRGVQRFEPWTLFTFFMDGD